MRRYAQLLACSLGGAFVVLALAGATCAAREPPNLAAGRPVLFVPQPDYALTAEGGTDPNDLTDGVTSARSDSRLWLDRKAVGFSYPGLVALSVDLGSEQPIGEVAIRLQGGSAQPPIAFPVWVDVVLSRDGRRYYQVQSYSRWQPGGRQRFGIPAEGGNAWVYRLAFTGLRVRARYVGLSLYGSGLMVADELWVRRGPEDSPPLPADPARAVPFCVEGAQVYFHKPVVQFSTNVATPNPVGLLCTLPEGTPLTVWLETPPGVQLAGGLLGGDPVSGFSVERLAGGRTRYTHTLAVRGGDKAWGRLYLAGSWEPGDEGEIRYQVSWPGGEAPPGAQRIRAVRIAPVARPKRLLVGMGWWELADTRAWPGVAQAFDVLGFSYVPVIPRHVADDADWRFLDWLRSRGLRVVSVDSPFHVMLERNSNAPELMCQLPDGPGKKLCPSYRGPAYAAEMARVEREAAKARPDLFAADIEIWGWNGPVDAPRCARCRQDFARSGTRDWAAWRIAKGVEMWQDLVDAVRRGSRSAGGPETQCGGYDFRPRRPYNQVWSVERLYPKWLYGSQVSTYSPLEPYHLELIGNRVREDRLALGAAGVIPWLTPGDAGVFPGAAFRDAVLEAFANGASGLLFWSGRVWDTETLTALADALRAAGPAEAIILDGQPLSGVASRPRLRLSGMRKGDEMFLLAADYAGVTRGPVRVSVPLTRVSEVVDLENGERAATVAPDSPWFTFHMEGARARPFLIRPLTSASPRLTKERRTLARLPGRSNRAPAERRPATRR